MGETQDPSSSDLAIAVIPARYGSTRIPGKPLAEIAGRPMIERVLERAGQARLVSRVIVATDDQRIADAVSPHGEVAMTRADHESGSDRVAEVVAAIDCDIVVNIQGDLPLLEPEIVDALIETLRNDRTLGMATVAVPVRSLDEMNDPSVVKLVCDKDGRALYFSRSAIPYDRDAPDRYQHAWHHVGVYAYRKDVLLAFAELPQTELEKIEKLEQLRALENGIGIGVVRRDDAAPMEVDTPEDLDRVRAAVGTG
jgi:3-deoxy-manno-octulosonate cytidylyltransferase (CMP-KDO synthetase)